MKIVILESQYKRLVEAEEEQEVLEIPSLKIFGQRDGVAWMRLQELLKKRGNPPYSIGGNLDLRGLPIESLGNLKFVGGDLYMRGTPLSKMYSKGEIGQMVNVGGGIHS
jgi:hypothetical protein